MQPGHSPSGDRHGRRVPAAFRRCSAPAVRWCVAAGVALLAQAPAFSAPAKGAPAADPEATATAVLDRVVADLWAHSDGYFHDGDYETASRVGRLCVRLDPNYIEAVTTVAWLLRQGLSRPEEAKAMLYRGIEANPGNYEVYFDLGMLYYDLKQYAQAERYVGEAVKHNAPPPVHHMLAHCYERLGRKADALRVWRATVEKFPKDMAARHNLQRMEKEE